jgi:GTP 3',8-cyclase
MPADGTPWRKTPLPSLEQLADASLILMQHTGKRQIKLTGGEPTVRRDLHLLVSRLAAHSSVDEISMTTNASRLRKLVIPLRDAGLDRVNISLDTLDSDRFHTMTRGSLSDVLDGISAAVEAGLKPVKLNAVLRRSYWKEDVASLLEYSAEIGAELRFIELMQTGTRAEWASGEFISANEVQGWLMDRSEVEQIPFSVGETSRRWNLNWQGHGVRVGWITPQSHAFCDGCKRIRMDAQGQVRRCLMDSHTFPLLEKLNTHPEAVVLTELDNYMHGKQPPSEMTTTSQMATVGG